MNTKTPLTPANPAPQQENIFEYIAVIMRRWKIFLTAFCAVFIAVALYTFLMKPVYEASSMLHIKDSKGNDHILSELSLNTTNPTNAEIEIVKSRSNAEHVVRRLHLNANILKKSDGLSFRILEFKTQARTPVYDITLTGQNTFDVRDDEGDLVGKGTGGVLMKQNGFSLLLDNIKGNPGDSFRLELAPFENVVDAVRNNIKAVEQGRQTGIIKVSYTSTDPVLARDIVNTLVQAYLEQSVSFKSEEASRAVSFIDDQIKSLRGHLDTSEKDLQVYKSSTGVVALDGEANALIEKISGLEQNRTNVNLQRQQIEFAREALKKAMKEDKVYVPGIMMSNPNVETLAAKLADLEVQKKALLTSYTEAHQAVKTVQNQIDEVQNKLLGIYETSRFNLAKQEEAIRSQLSAYEKEMQALPNVERDLARLTRVSKVNSDIYTFLLQKHEEARIAKASTISNIVIVDPAITPGRPVKPKVGQNLLLGLLFGLALGIGLAFFQEYLDDTIKDAEEAKRATGLPLLATIPHIPGYDAPAKNGFTPPKQALITQKEPKSMVAEAFRSLRTNLHFTAIHKEKKIMLFTSTFPREGKSTITANEAVVIAQTGARVLIIDCDLRRSSLHEKFGHSKTPGLTEILTGDAAFDKAKHNTGIPGLDLISAGTTPPNPSELLGSEAMRRFLLAQRENYDFIIIDAPPVLAVTDAPVLATISDIVILIMEAGRVPLKAAQHVRETLATLQASVAGLIINDKTGKGETYGYYGSRYYRYGKGYGYGYGYGYGQDYGYGYYSDEEKKPLRNTRWEKLINLLPEKLRTQIRNRLRM
ncbi:MAG TPA: polysaccharide biosynthesis tyrosine autokinase [Smithella sp.]|nr:polysaccharide biosynthesis tyrosine autokinase [Smithella sp.]